jgi:L,D-peptidoglycan transpeptidase YkuD (ErfK/YbiS/YcfS/YnhG family)
VTANPTVTPFHFPVPVSVGDAHQIVTVSATGSYANVVAWQWKNGTWHAVIQTKSARIGTNGVVPATQRKQGTSTTPAGTFTMTEAFGISANPGTKMPYHLVTTDDWWVEDNNSAYYNSMRGASQGGFAVTTSGVNGSEHLITFTTQYRYVVVINFNRPPNAVRYRGAGIFLHVNGPGSTAGCVSVPLATMVAIITWLDPAQHPRIAIA